MMYCITKIAEDKFNCFVRLQDGHEVWSEKSLEQAKNKVIAAARVLNGENINEEMITYTTAEIKPAKLAVSKEDEELLVAIKTGLKVVLDFDDYRLKYNLTERECLMVQDIREGKKSIMGRY